MANYKKGSAAAKAYMAKLRAARGKTKVGVIAKTKKGTNKKTLNKYEKTYNNDVDKYKYFVVDGYGNVDSGWEYKSDALDQMKENLFVMKNDQAEWNVYTLNTLKRLRIPDPRLEWKYKISGTKIKKVGAKAKAPAKAKTRKASSIHKDTKSHNVNIKVMSGFTKFYKYKGFTIDVMGLFNGKKEYVIYQISPVTNKEVYYGTYKTLSAAKKWIDRTLYLLKKIMNKKH